MPPKLNANDGTAIDLLLDQTERSRVAHNAGYVQPSDSVFHRVAPAQKLLNLLETWEVEEPPKDLIQRTLAKIDNAQPNSSSGFGTSLGDSHPNA